MAFPGTKYNKFERSWVISRCYQHLVEIVLVTHLNNISKKEWLAEYKASIGVKELGSAEARSLLKEQFETLSSRDWEDYLLWFLPEGSAWRRILEKGESERSELCKA